MQATANLSMHVLKKAIERYYKQLQDYKGRLDYELAVRTAFLNLLNETAHQVKWMLIPEQTIEGGIRPDGVLRDSFDLKRGFWEAKGTIYQPGNQGCAVNRCSTRTRATTRAHPSPHQPPSPLQIGRAPPVILARLVLRWRPGFVGR